MVPLENASMIERFLSKESTPGILLMFAAVAAIVCANTPLNAYYDLLLSVRVEIRIGALFIGKPLLLWINDGLMAVFFFLVGLELKREFLEGELADPSKILLPAVGAVGGMAVPALIYMYFNAANPLASQGWAIPAATDIAFALGVLVLLGSRVPVSVKVFLTTLAIFDDVGAIVIIAVFYTDQISATALWSIAAALVVLWLLNRYRVVSLSPYIFVGVVMWVATLKSGVHATLAGVLLAAFIPMRDRNNPDHSPLINLEHDLKPVVFFLILPVFAFANAGIELIGVGLDVLTHDVTKGIALGLIFGKQIGIFGLCALAVRLGFAKLPEGMNWLSLYGTAALCGIGFTMSLFIGSLAFEATGVDIHFDERLGIIMGSLVSGTLGYFVLRFAFADRSQAAD